MIDALRIKGARQHNLKNVSLTIPKNKLVVFTGVSGSGKSSLAFDTIYAEGQRRYVESLSSYARQFLGIMNKPDVDSIEGLSPAISIDQKSASHNPRSTVGTVTEIYDYLRLLYARIGHPHCPNCGREISRQTSSQIVANIIRIAGEELKKKQGKIIRFMIMSPVVRDRKGEFSGLFTNLRSKGYHHVRVDGRMYSVDDDIILIRTNKHSIDVVIDRFTLDHSSVKALLAQDASSNNPAKSLKTRITDAVEQSLGLSQGLVYVGFIGDPGFEMPEHPKSVKDIVYSERFSCPVCNISIPEIEPRSFSFNSPHGACPHCSGIGSILSVDPGLVIAPALSLSEGGIIPFAKMFYHDTWYTRVIKTVAEEHGIDTQKPLGELSKDQLNILLYGTGDRRYRVHGTNRFGEHTVIDENFTGVIAEIKRRYTQTESDFVRQEIEKYMRLETCPECLGKRLKPESLNITIDGKNIAEATALNITDIRNWFNELKEGKREGMSAQETVISHPILKEITARLTFLIDVGLEYLTLDRTATTLSGGEAQRIRLASQIGSGLSGVLYVLDEPSIGLHPRDNAKLIDTLINLKKLGNTVIVVEHDRDMMEAADYLVDFGPGAGKHGGKVIAQGSVSEVKQNPESVTAKYLTFSRKITRPNIIKPPTNGMITLTNATHNNLKNITVSFPTGRFICVTGASGSGKSSLVVETLYRAMYTHFNPYSRERAGNFGRLEGLEHIDKVILIDQSPIGRTPRSNPATYTGIFTYIRQLFSELPGSRMRGFTPGRFSFNVKGGRCEACEGEGQKKIEMQFLSDVYVTCEVCNGTRYSAETLEILYKDKNIAQVLDLTVEDAREFFSNIPVLSEKLSLMQDVGLGYMNLGQPATTLSGGEAQRVKLSTELMRKATGKTVYILDEPTTGLHFADLEKLLDVLHRLTAYGNTVIVIEHNLDIIKNADYVIDLGPDGGDRGGEVVATGTPEEVSQIAKSHTGQFLRKSLK